MYCNRELTTENIDSDYDYLCVNCAYYIEIQDEEYEDE